MTLENQIKSVIEQKLADGTVEKLVAEKFEQGINNALDNMFRSYGDITEVIEKQLKKVMIPYIEKHDFNQYLIKLDTVLTELSNSVIKDNKKILDNFKTLMEPVPKEIKSSELFNKWLEYAADNIETDGLEVEFDDRPSYETVEVTMSFEQLDSPSWSSFENGQLLFECDHDEDINFVIPLHRWKEHEDYWTITDLGNIDLSSLKNISSFEVFIRSLKQNYTKILIDTDYEIEDLQPSKEPEPNWM